MPVLNLKGGTSKTTTAVFLAHVLHEQGRRVVLVDADPQASAVEWNRDAPEPFPFKVLGLPSARLHEQLHDHLARDVEAVVIDTPPLQEAAGIVVSTLRVATVAVVPVAPTPIEYGRLAAVMQTVRQAAGFRPRAEPVPVAVLLTRTIPNASSTDIWRQRIREDGLWCLEADVRRLERFAQAAGDNITGAAETSYGETMVEIEAGRR